jgi:hypothetical protein
VPSENPNLSAKLEEHHMIKTVILACLLACLLPYSSFHLNGILHYAFNVSECVLSSIFILLLHIWILQHTIYCKSEISSH